MAKKKQLAGKKTKLAKLPLTRALTGREPDPTWPPAGTAPPAPDFLEEGAAAADPGDLADIYLYLLQELTFLQTQLHPARNPLNPTAEEHLPPPPPLDPLLMELALWRARKGLRDLQRFLSRS